MTYNHGISTSEAKTSASTPVTAGSGIAFVVGTAPVHLVNGKINVPILANNYSEAVAALGFSSDFSKFSLCEVMYSHFKLFGVGPVIFVNVLDPEKHKIAVPEALKDIVDGKVTLPSDAILATVVVKGESGTPTYTKGTDYDLFYDGDKLVIERITTGTIASNTTKLKVAYSAVDATKVTEAEIIGGFDVNTKQTSGFELLNSAFPRFGIVPDLLLAPGWSHKSAVAAVMSSKAQNINGIFEGKALIDVDTSTVKHYTDVPAWKKLNNINSKSQLVFFPKVKLGDMVFHMSTQAAGLMAKVDVQNGSCPCEGPSNKGLQMDSTVLVDGTEVVLDVQQVNFLNSNGVVTALSFIGGFVLWGNETACFPASTDVKDYFIAVSRMFSWVSNSVVLSYWSKLDGKLNRRLIHSITDSLNIWLNGLTSEEKLLGGRVEFKAEENNDVALMSGKAVFHIYLTPPSPAKEIHFIKEYDVNYVASALKA